MSRQADHCFEPFHRLGKTSGFMCVDMKGLVLSTSGVAKEETGPYVAAVGKLASQLEQPGEDVVVVIGTRNRYVSVQFLIRF